MPFIVSYLCLFIVGRFSLILILVQVFCLNGIVIPICHFDTHSLRPIMHSLGERIKRSVPHIIHLNSITINSINSAAKYSHSCSVRPSIHLSVHKCIYAVIDLPPHYAHTQQQTQNVHSGHTFTIWSVCVCWFCCVVQYENTSKIIIVYSYRARYMTFKNMGITPD